MDHDARVRQREAPALGAGGEEQGAHRRRLAHADGGYGRLHVLHRVIDGEARGHRPARAVDVEIDVLVRVLALQEEHLGDDHVGHVVVHGGTEEDDAVLEEPREDVPAALAAVSLLDDRRDDEALCIQCTARSGVAVKRA